MKKPPEKITYKTRPIRMDDRTWKLFKEKKIKSGLSWNRYIYNLIKEKP